MIGSFKPNCKCKDKKGNPFPRPKVTFIQVKNIPFEVEYVIECKKCNKRWEETCLIYGENVSQ